MKPNRVIAFAVLVLSSMLAVAAQQTFTGTLTDNMCAKEKTHMMPGKSDAECVRECAKHGGYYVLATPDNKVYRLKADARQLESLAGKKVAVKGELQGDTITVGSIAAK